MPGSSYRKIDQDIIDFLNQFASRGVSPNTWTYGDAIQIMVMPLTEDFAEWQKSIGQNFDEPAYKNVLVLQWEGDESEMLFCKPTTVNEMKDFFENI